MMIAVFKTMVKNKKEAKKIVIALELAFTTARVNFDLEDCDRILRVEASDLDTELVQKIVLKHGHRSELLL